MSHNLKTTKASDECGEILTGTYCGPRSNDSDRARFQMIQKNIPSHAHFTSTINLTKKQARDLATSLLVWSDS